MFGAIYGDIIGSYYENHCTKDYNFPFQRDSFFTDDTVLTAAVCKAILENPEEIGFFGIKKRAMEYGANYRQYYSYYPNAGFGNMFSKWARESRSKNGKSYGNGASMRVIPIAYAYESFEQVKLQVKASCVPTHNNREAIKCAMAVACATWLALHGESKEKIREYVEKNFFSLPKSVATIREKYAFSSRSLYSVPPAISAFLDSSDYESAVRLAISLGGDADTQACIAGGIAEAFYGEIPKHIKDFCDPKLEMTVKDPVKELIYKLSHGKA